MLTKVSNLIKQSYSNLASQLGVNSISSGATKNLNIIPTSPLSNPQVTEIAAKIINKSPLEADFDTPTEHIKRNPYEFGVVYYPENVATLAAGHYMRFDIYKNNKEKFLSNNISSNKSSNLIQEVIRNAETSGFRGLVNNKTSVLLSADENTSRVRDSQNNSRRTGIQRANNTHAFVTDTIILYTPPQVKTTYGVQYDTPETGTLGAAAGASGFLDSLFGGANILGQGLRDTFLGAISALPAAGDATAVAVKKSATARNPNLEVVFKSVPFRKFQYIFEFTPKNKKEVVAIDKILKLFRYHMQPGLQGGSSSFFTVPSEFELTYMYIDKGNSYIPKIARCVLETMEIDQSPEGVFTTFKSDESGAFPTSTKMTLSFSETEIMTKQKIADGF